MMDVEVLPRLMLDIKVPIDELVVDLSSAVMKLPSSVCIIDSIVTTWIY